MEEDRFACPSLSRFLTENVGFSEEAIAIIEASWITSTGWKCQGHTNKFWRNCSQRNINPAEPNVKIGIEYLTQYFHTGVSYSSANTARSLLPSILKPKIGTSFGDDPLVCRLVKGIFTLRPSLPRYTTAQDVAILLRYTKSLPLLNECDLKTLLYRLEILLRLITGQRYQTMSDMNLDLMNLRLICNNYICTKTTQTNTARAPPETHGFHVIQWHWYFCFVTPWEI